MKKKYEWSKLFDIFFIINASSDIVWEENLNYEITVQKKLFSFKSRLQNII